MASVVKLIISQTGGSRTWEVAFGGVGVPNVSPGGSLNVYAQMSTTGITPPPTPDTWTVRAIADDGTVIRSWTVPSTTSTSQQSLGTFYFTSDGTSTGAPRAGVVTFELRVTASGVGAYDWDSDGSPQTLAGGQTPTFSRVTNSVTALNIGEGYNQARTNMTVALTSGGSNKDPYAYGDVITATVTTDHALYAGTSWNVTWGPKTVAVTVPKNATSGSAAFSGSVDNAYPAALTAYTTTRNNGSNSAVLVGGSPTERTRIVNTTHYTGNVDPRITFAHLFQVNDNTWGTPPLSKDKGNKRLQSDLAFLGARARNARAEGVNGLTWSVSIGDAGGLVSAQTRSGVVSQAQGGENGWSDQFLVWDKNLPGGTWNKTVTITGPAGAVGLEVDASKVYTLLATDLRLRVITAGGPAITVGDTVADDRHFSPGKAFLAGAAVINVETGEVLNPDVDTVEIAIGRFNQITGKAEFLDDTMSWQNAELLGAYWFTPVQASTVIPGGGTKTFIAMFTAEQTAGWGTADLFVVAKAEYNGSPVVNDYAKEIVVSGINNHDAYRFDGAGFVGFPSR